MTQSVSQKHVYLYLKRTAKCEQALSLGEYRLTDLIAKSRGCTLSLDEISDLSLYAGARLRTGLSLELVKATTTTPNRHAI